MWFRGAPQPLTDLFTLTTDQSISMVSYQQLVVLPTYLLVLSACKNTIRTILIIMVLIHKKKHNELQTAGAILR